MCNIYRIGKRIWMYIKEKRMKSQRTRDDGHTGDIPMEQMNGVTEQQEETDPPPVWKKDDGLAPCDGMLSIGKHSLFSEYLEIGKYSITNM